MDVDGLPVFPWKRLWGIECEVGEISEGDVVLMESSNGRRSKCQVVLIMYVTFKDGHEKIRALVTDV